MTNNSRVTDRQRYRSLSDEKDSLRHDLSLPAQYERSASLQERSTNLFLFFHALGRPCPTCCLQHFVKYH